MLFYQTGYLESQKGQTQAKRAKLRPKTPNSGLKDQIQADVGQTQITCLIKKEQKRKGGGGGKQQNCGGGGGRGKTIEMWWWWWRENNSSVVVVVVGKG